jgi:hypothetical protein
MAWDVNQIYSLVLYLTNKNQSSGISSTDLFNAWNLAQAEYHEDLVGRWNKQNNTKTGIKTGLVEDEITASKLAPFTLSVPITITAGFAPKPADYIYGWALRINGENVTQIDPDQVWAVNEDVIDPPSVATNTYYFTEYSMAGVNGFSILPPAATSLILDYIAETTDIVWAFTFDVDGRQVYDSVNSVQPKWNKNTTIEITKRTLDSFGIRFKDQDFEAAGVSVEKTGV